MWSSHLLWTLLLSPTLTFLSSSFACPSFASLCTGLAVSHFAIRRAVWAPASRSCVHSCCHQGNASCTFQNLFCAPSVLCCSWFFFSLFCLCTLCSALFSLTSDSASCLPHPQASSASASTRTCTHPLSFPHSLAPSFIGVLLPLFPFMRSFRLCVPRLHRYSLRFCVIPPSFAFRTRRPARPRHLHG